VQDDGASTVAGMSLAGRPARPSRCKQASTAVRLTNLNARAPWDADDKSDERSVCGGRGLLLASGPVGGRLGGRQPGVPFPGTIPLSRRNEPPPPGAYGGDDGASQASGRGGGTVVYTVRHGDGGAQYGVGQYSDGNGRLPIEGLPPDEEDALYESLGESATMSAVGAGSVFTIAGPAHNRVQFERMRYKSTIGPHDFAHKGEGDRF